MQDEGVARPRSPSQVTAARDGLPPQCRKINWTESGTTGGPEVTVLWNDNGVYRVNFHRDRRSNAVWRVMPGELLPCQALLKTHFSALSFDSIRGERHLPFGTPIVVKPERSAVSIISYGITLGRNKRSAKTNEIAYCILSYVGYQTPLEEQNGPIPDWVIDLVNVIQF